MGGFYASFEVGYSVSCLGNEDGDVSSHPFVLQKKRCPVFFPRSEGHGIQLKLTTSTSCDHPEVTTRFRALRPIIGLSAHHVPYPRTQH